MIFHENHLPVDDSPEISYLIFSIIGKDVKNFLAAAGVIDGLWVNGIHGMREGSPGHITKMSSVYGPHLDQCLCCLLW